MFNLPDQKDWGLLVVRLAFGGLMLSHGKKELALLYLAGCLAISLLGAGRYSLDAILGSNKA